jgi:peptidoglycan/xylan/chitin deacetylase (PgdA/CDA1 family)
VETNGKKTDRRRGNTVCGPSHRAVNPVSLLFHDVFLRDPGESGFSSPAADRYKLSIAEFDSQLAQLDACAANERPPARFTFDDGGVSYYTVVADRLEARGWRGHCFVPTAFIGTPGFLDRDQICELDRRGHTIGTHSASHPSRFSALTPAAMALEWSRSCRVLEDLLGHAVITGSVPGGYFSRAAAIAAAETGLEWLFTSEPVTGLTRLTGCTVAGRFTVRRGTRPDFSRKLVSRAPWTRYGQWVSWNAKGLVKPLLGSSYPRVADWIYGGLR